MIRIQHAIAAALACALAGCASAPKPPAPKPAPVAALPGDGAPVATAAVVPVSAVVNQLKCDLGSFLKAQDKPSPDFTIYDVAGTLTFSLERSTAGGWSMAIAPSATWGPISASANFGRSKSSSADTADDVVLKFDMASQPDPADDPHAQTAVDAGACQRGLGPDAHLIDPEALKSQIDGIVAGAPKVGFSTVEYKGKFLLKRDQADTNKISLFIISGSFPSSIRDSAYTQQFDITLQLQPPPKPAAPKLAPVAAEGPEPAEATPERRPIRRHRAPAPAQGAFAPEFDHPMLGASPPPEPPAPAGLSDHLRRLIETAPTTGAPPAPGP